MRIILSVLLFLTALTNASLADTYTVVQDPQALWDTTTNQASALLIPGAGQNGKTPITTGVNGLSGPLTLTGSGVSCAGTNCTITGGGGGNQLSGVVTTPSSSSGVTSFGTFNSATLAAAISDETGTGSAVFSNSPTLVTPVLGAATATSINGAAVAPNYVRTVASGASDTLPTTDGSGRTWTIATQVWNSTTASNKTSSIPACSSSNSGAFVNIKDNAGTSATYPIVVTPASGTIEGASTATLSGTGKPNLLLQCDGTSNWMVE